MTLSPAPSRDSPGGSPCLHCGLPLGLLQSSRGFCCFGCRFAHQIALPDSNEGDEPRGSSSAPSTMFLRLGLGIFLSFNIMAVSWVFYSQEVFGQPAAPGGSYSSLTELFAYLAFFLTTAVMALLGIPLLSSLFRSPNPKASSASDLRSRWQLGSSHLILLGVFSAYALSAINTFRGHGSLYFDTAAMVLVAVTLGSFIEGQAKKKAVLSALSINRSLPLSVLVRRREAPQEIPLEELLPGEEVRVLPGEIIAIDGTISEGRSRVEEARLTGEAQPRTVQEGNGVLAGTMNLEGQLWVRCERVGSDTVLAQTKQALEQARGQQPVIQRLADRVAGFFVPAVILLALGVFTLLALRGEPAEGLLRSLSVLLISCPCALGLAAPLASWNALRQAALEGLLVDSPATLEKAAKVDRIYLDKTGTLTEPELDLSMVVTAKDLSPETALRWAAHLEASSPHPIARALLRHLEPTEEDQQQPVLEPVEEGRVVPGRGVEGILPQSALPHPKEISKNRDTANSSRLLRLGSATWLREHSLSPDFEPVLLSRETTEDAARETAKESDIYLFSQDQALARFRLTETLRPQSQETIQHLGDLGIEAAVLSGDAPQAVSAATKILSIAAEGSLLPAEKVARLTQKRQEAKSPRQGLLAMVGDGLNDAAVLAAADVGIAMGSASDLARRSSNVRLVDDQLDRLPRLFQIARHCRSRIRLNLIFSFTFNSLGIGLAIAGRLNPVFAAAAMVISSLVVVRISSTAGQGLQRRSHSYCQSSVPAPTPAPSPKIWREPSTFPEGQRAEAES